MRWRGALRGHSLQIVGRLSNGDWDGECTCGARPRGRVTTRDQLRWWHRDHKADEYTRRWG